MSKKRSRNPELRAFGAYLQQLRGDASREQISIKLRGLGVPLGGSTLVQYEKGTVWAPDPGVLWGLATIYRQPVDRLLALLRINRLDPSLGDAGDLLRHADAYQSAASKERAADVPASAQFRDLRSRVAAIEGVLTAATEDLRAIVGELDDAVGEPRRSKRGTGGR